MKYKTAKFIAFSVIMLIVAGVCLYVLAHGNNSKPPAFKDGGKTINSLKETYQCKTIEFDNWYEGDKTDSTLTVCLVNSAIVNSRMIIGSDNFLKTIATQIKNAVAHPENYNAYYIIFAEKKQQIFTTMKSHTAGERFPAQQL